MQWTSLYGNCNRSRNRNHHRHSGSGHRIGYLECFARLYFGHLLDYHASAPATTDVTIAFSTRGGNVLAVSNNATDALYHPRAKPVDNANTAITNAHDKFAISDTLTISLAESDALTGAVTAYIHVLRV